MAWSKWLGVKSSGAEDVGKAVELSGNFRKPFGKREDYAPAAPVEDILDILHRTVDESIAFVHRFPAQHDRPSLTFFGGLPMVPSDFQWPRSTRNGLPLSFLGQVDCSALPNIQLRHFLPRTGVLYFFVDWDLFDGHEEAQNTKDVVKYAAGPVDTFAEAVPPADLPPMYGTNACYRHKWLELTDRSTRDYPKSSPKWVVQMDKLLTYAEEHPTETDGNSAGRYQELWQKAQLDELQRVYGAPVKRDETLKKPDHLDRGKTVWRPFPSFPHAWLAVEMVCGHLLHALKRASQDLKRGKVATGEQWPADPVAHRAIYDQVAVDAASWIATARAKGLMQAPTECEKSTFWSWLDALHASVGGGSTDQLFDARSNYTTNSCILESVHRACDECLAHSAAAAALVPSNIADELRAYHSPLVEGRGQTAGRHIMLGRGRNVQGAPERMEGSRVLLMQFDTDAGLNWMMGDCGALQYWTTLDDLRALRFGRVKATLEGH